MDIFDVLTMAGGLCLFLFGMSVMGQALERRAGGKLSGLLGKLAGSRAAGLLTGLVVTAVIQSSSAATVMVVGFSNSGLMTLRQAVNVIMGANIGTTVTAWVLSLAGIESGNVLVKLLKPSSFTPVLALAGIICYMFCKSAKKKDTGTILLGFATLMTGMETMSGAVSGLGEVPAFQDLFLTFQNPLLGVLAGAVLTAVIQSSSASVGILQALAVTGQVSYGAAVPIIMGQNIGTCVTAMLSSIGANKNARRAAMVHLSFNVIGSVVWLTVFSIVRTVFHPAVLGEPASLPGIAAAHTVFNVLCTVLMLPLSGFLERLVIRLVPDAGQPELQPELDERLLAAPFAALERCQEVAGDMARAAVAALTESLDFLCGNRPKAAASIHEKEEKTDHCEDILSTYLVQLSSRRINESDSAEAAMLLKIIGDFERIADHAVNILECAGEMREKKLSFSAAADSELAVIVPAVREILDLSLRAFLDNDMEAASMVEPLEQVIDSLKEKMRTRHIFRLQQGGCRIETGFIWSDLLTDLERTADHCSNIAGCIMDLRNQSMNLHESLRNMRQEDPQFRDRYAVYAEKYPLAW